MSRTSRNHTTLQAPSDIPSTGKYTRYNRETMDYDAFFGGQYLGSRDSMDAARDLVNEHVYDLEQSGMLYTATALDADASIEEIAADTEYLPAVSATAVQGHATVYASFYAGCDLTEVMIGPHGSDKPGVELVIGGMCINMERSEVITMADVQTIRDNLTALLNDARLWAACQAVAV